MSKHLYLFTISPVQTFIEQARKTHDLFAGSRILSDLITVAMEKLKAQFPNEEDCKFIFPVMGQDSKPNRFIAIVNRDNMQELGEHIQKSVHHHFVEILGKEVIALFEKDKAVINQNSVRTQLQDFLKIYWVANCYDETANYASQIRQLEQNLGAVKNIRHFKQFSEKGRKCSMNGEYNVKFYRKTQNESKKNSKPVKGDKNKLFHSDVTVFNVHDEPKAGEKKHLRVSHLQPGEGLCAISLMKRFYNDNNEFESTANIALLDTLNEILKTNEGKTNDDEFSLCLGKKNKKNGQLYFEENLTKEYFDKQGMDEGAIKCATEKLGEIKKVAKRLNLKFSKYYAILAFDADGMGNKLQKCLDSEEHTRVSELLADFAGVAEKHINSKKFGRTVYAGGDDFLGFINLNYLFDVMKNLREKFDEKVNQHLREELKMTFSAGVSIAHYKTPLSETLRWAKQMEKEAKKVLHITSNEDKDKKNAFSIAVLKRSGETHYSTWRWFRDNEGTTEWGTDLYFDVIKALNSGNISKKYITNLGSEYTKRLDKDGNWGQEAIDYGFVDELNKMLSFELEYFMLHAKAESYSKTDTKNLAKRLYDNYKYHVDNFGLSVQNFLNMLHICEFISREINPIDDDKNETQFSKQLQNENT